MGTILTMSMITNEALRILENNLAFTKGVNREYDDKFGVEGAKIGDTLNIRKPVRYVGRTGKTLNTETHTETSVPLTLDTQFGVDVNFSSKDMYLSLDDFSNRILKPAMATIANKIDYDGLQLYKDVNHYVGTIGSTPTSIKTFAQANAWLDRNATPRDDMRSCVIGPDEQVEIIDSLKALFHSSTEIDRQYREGNMGMAAGNKWSMDQNVGNHTVGTWESGSTGVTAGANQSGSTISTDGWANSTDILKAGDIITIADVYHVNPQNRQSTGQLMQFVVTEDVTSTGGGLADIPISPALTSSGAYQNVDSNAGDGKAITVFAASSEDTQSVQNLVYHRDAFTLACADLPLPTRGVTDAARVSDNQLGMSMRMIRAYDVNNDNWPCRIDVLYGWRTLYPELACRVVGGQ